MVKWWKNGKNGAKMVKNFTNMIQMVKKRINAGSFRTHCTIRVPTANIHKFSSDSPLKKSFASFARIDPIMFPGGAITAYFAVGE